jgi:hypothetical protein
VGFTAWDIIEGYLRAKECVKEGVLNAQKQRIEKLKGAFGVSAKELQEMDLIPTNEEFKKIGLTDEDLRDLGLLDVEEEYPILKR